MTASSQQAAPAAPLETDAADGVFEGGGVKGIALVGALEAARDHGIERWVNVAGTSAGAIIASLLAVGYDPGRLREILDETNYNQFADYGRGGRIMGGLRNAVTGRGLCPGRAFEKWLGERFAESPVGKADPTFTDVERDDLPADLSDDEREKARYRLRVIASDITEGRMLVLPDDIVDYTDKDGRPYTKAEFPLTKAVRMSMSFPYFFDPVTLYRNGQVHYIVDGGLLSNFPVFLFDGEKPPLRRWTFGFRLYGGTPPEQPSYRMIGRIWPLPLGKAMFFAATEAWDRKSSKASRVRTVSIPTGEVPTLKFELSNVDRDLLRTNGFEAAREFFEQQRTYINHSGVEAAGPAGLSRPVRRASNGDSRV